MNSLWIVFAIIATLANAGSNLLQRVANHQQRPSLKSLSGLRQLASSPAWIGGFVCLLISLVAQVTALAVGSLAAVETLLVLELPVAIIGGVIFFGTRPHVREWAGLICMTASTILLILVLNPRETVQAGIPPFVWIMGVGSSAALIIVPLLLSFKLARDLSKAALRGVATGVAFALAAVFAKGMTLELHQGGWLHLAVSWETYAALAMASGSIWLLQYTLRSGKLIATQPGITLASPYVAIAWGVLVFHEHIRLGVALWGAAGCLIVLSGSVILMASSPVLANE